MRTRVEMDGARSAITQLNGSRSKLRQGWKSGAFRVGAESVKVGRDGFKTEVRSAQRRRSYGHAVSDLRDGVALDIGPIKPSVGGKVPLHARVLEGFNAAGRKVSRFIIRPKRAEYLHFPIRRGPGLAASTIVGWVRTKGPIELKPDPSFPRVEKYATPQLEKLGADVFRQVLG